MLGSGEILVILFVILILFGGKKLPEFAQSLGKGIREFKKACYGEEDTRDCTSCLHKSCMKNEIKPDCKLLSENQDDNKHL